MELNVLAASCLHILSGRRKSLLMKTGGFRITCLQYRSQALFSAERKTIILPEHVAPSFGVLTNKINVEYVTCSYEA